MHRFIAFLMLMLLFSCSQNPVDKSDSPKAKGKIAIVCKSASSVTAKIAATDRAEIWIWKTLDTMPRIEKLQREDGTNYFIGEFEVDTGTYTRVSINGYGADNSATWMGTTNNVVVEANKTTNVPIWLKKRGGVEVIFGIGFTQLPSGGFVMGDRYNTIFGENERPYHNVILTEFMMSIYEITQEQYFKVTGVNPSLFNSNGGNMPVEQVSWWDAIKFCNALSDKLGLSRCYNEITGDCDFTKDGIRLPTEAEWEYACQGTEFYYFKYGTDDGTLDQSKANYISPYLDGNIYHPVNVGSYPPNPYGLYDMSGNVFEWCNDWYSPYTSDKQYNPKGPRNGYDRIIRGGSWSHEGSFFCRASKRDYSWPFTIGFFSPYRGGYGNLGFRIVINSPSPNIPDEYKGPYFHAKRI